MIDPSTRRHRHFTPAQNQPAPSGSHLTAGTLVEVLPAYRCLELEVYAVYPSRKFLASKVRLLIDFLVEAFREKKWPE